MCAVPAGKTVCAPATWPMTLASECVFFSLFLGIPGGFLCFVDVFICFYDNIVEKEYRVLIEAQKFIEWFGSKEIAEIKENTIKIIEKL